MKKRVIVRLKSIRYMGESIGETFLLRFQIGEVVTTFSPRIPFGKTTSFRKVLFDNEFPSMDDVDLPVQLNVTEQEEREQYNDIGSESISYHLDMEAYAPQTAFLLVAVTATQGSDKGKKATFKVTLEAEVAHATVVVSVVSKYDHAEGVAHKLTIKSTFDERKEVASLTKAGAVKTEHGLDRPFLEGKYEIRVEPYPIDGEDIGPSPLGKSFQEILYVRSNLENRVTREITRKESIIHNIPIIFRVSRNPDADGSTPLRELRPMSTVSKYQAIIEAEALALGLDGDLIKAVMYMETTHGYYDKLIELFDKNKSILPMNVRSDHWRELGYSRKELKTAEVNIRVGALLLKRISVRVHPASIDTIAAVYNDLETTVVTDYAARVKRIYDEKLWIPPASFLERIGAEVDDFNRMAQPAQLDLLKKMFGG